MIGALRPRYAPVSNESCKVHLRVWVWITVALAPFYYFKNRSIQEQSSGECEVLRIGRDIPIDREVAQEHRDFGPTHLSGVPLAMEVDEPFDPVHIGFFGPQAIVPDTDLIADLIEDSRSNRG